MELRYVIYMGIAAFLACCLGVFIFYLRFKWTLYSKLNLMFVYVILAIAYGTAAVMYGEFSFIRFAIILSIEFVVIFFPVIWYIQKVLVMPIKSVDACLDGLGEGDFSIQMDIPTGDEFGLIATKFNNMIMQVSLLINTIKSNTSENREKAENLFKLSTDLTRSATETSDKSNKVAPAATDMSFHMQGLATAVKEASDNLNIVAAAIEEMTSTIGEIAKHSEEARIISDDAVKQSLSVSGRVGELGIAAETINDVIEAINDISEQTNLLALNATIEAARAGDVGKGFAVVAAEIKELARQTTEATYDIKEKIEGIQSSTHNTVKDIKQISDVTNRGNEIISIIAASVEEQAAATKEIAQNVAMASKGVEEINHNIAASTQASKEIASDIFNVGNIAGNMMKSTSQLHSSADDMSGQARRLSEMIDKFKTPKQH